MEYKTDAANRAVDYGWLSPRNDANRKSKIDALVDMATRYEIDGIHLDHNRANGSFTMFELDCKARFQTE